MLDPDTTRHADLRSGNPPWLAGVTRPVGAAPQADLRCEVAIIGGGITGCMMAEHLTAMGRDVVLVDRERAGFGSTLASTAMLQWEIDLPLRRLAALYGFEAAADVYRRSFSAVAGLTDLAGELGLSCNFLPRDTIYLSSGEIGRRELQEESELRHRAGLPGLLLDHQTLLANFGLDREAAIVSPGSAEADPLSLCHALLDVAARRGAKILRDEAVSFDGTASAAAVILSGGQVIEAEHVVLATGYVMPDCVVSDLHQIASSWALATVPQGPQGLWPSRALIWEASEDYVYCRTTSEGRIVFGGEDEEHDDPARREAQADAKTAALQEKLQALLPGADSRVSHHWSGAFGKTADGLPLIGRVPGQPRMLAAYGYGGNGITFSFLASRLLGALIAGEERPWFRHFAIDRPHPL